MNYIEREIKFLPARPGDVDKNRWLRHQVGVIELKEEMAPTYQSVPPYRLSGLTATKNNVPVFRLVGFGSTPEEARAMAKRKEGQAL